MSVFGNNLDILNGIMLKPLSVDFKYLETYDERYERHSACWIMCSSLQCWEVGPTWWMRTALHSGRPLAPYSMAQAVEILGLGASHGGTIYIYIYLGGCNSNILGYFCPEPWAKMNPILTFIIFQVGWNLEPPASFKLPETMGRGRQCHPGSLASMTRLHQN